MQYDRFLIAPSETGLQRDLKPWLIQDDAWNILQNAYIFRGRLRKRFGEKQTGVGGVSSLNSRVAVNLGMTDGGGVFAGTVPGSVFKIGQQFEVNGIVFTVVTAGVTQPMLRTDGSVEAATYSTTNGAVAITIAAQPNQIVYFYPAEPIMGLTLYETGPINNQPAWAFDTQFAYTFAAGFWERQGTAVWHGNNANFFWAANWEGQHANNVVMFVTNFNAVANGASGANDDPIWSYNGATWAIYATAGPGAPNTVVTTNGTTGTPATTFVFVLTARIIVAFKDRLIFLNTIEKSTPANTNANFPQRCRYSHNGSPFAANAWLEPNQTIDGTVFGDGAGFIDATTEEQIISSEFIKDRLIVYFERSTWELVYTGNQVQPFVWQKINTELGSEATFSSVPFDKHVLTMGTTGVHACSGSNVERIDVKIPDEIFNLRNDNDGLKRVAGIRDYATELVYWTFPTASYVNPNSKTFPNQILVYNYRNNTWAFFDDSITAWGYFEQQTGTTWQDVNTPWQVQNYAWNSGIIQAEYRQVIAGNQQGYIFIVAPDNNTNAAVLEITNIALNANPAFLDLTIIDHNLQDFDDPDFFSDYILYSSVVGTGNLPLLNGQISRVYDIPSSSVVTVTNPLPPGAIGTYRGGGNVTRVSNIDIRSKEWNPYILKGRNVYIYKIDFSVQKTTNGQVTVDYYSSDSQLSLVEEGQDSQAIIGNNVLETTPYQDVPLEQVQGQLWHPVYFQSDGTSIQIEMYMNDAQMMNPAISTAPFELEGLLLWTAPTTNRPY